MRPGRGTCTAQRVPQGAAPTGPCEIHGRYVEKSNIASGDHMENQPLRDNQKRARKLGEPSGTRTLDPLIKSQALYQLS